MPAPSKKAFGKDGKALDGVRILDFTHVQSGPTCTQLLAWFGADVIKVERPGAGDATRSQLRDVPDADSLYFTMLNHNKRSVTLNTKTESGKQIFTRLIEECDVMVENFAPGAIDRMGFPWEKIQEINPRMIYASVKGFGPGPYEDCKVYENIAQSTGGAASTTGFLDGPPLVTRPAPLPSTRTSYPSRPMPRPVISNPINLRAICSFLATRASRPTKSPLSSLTIQPRPACSANTRS